MIKKKEIATVTLRDDNLFDGRLLGVRRNRANESRRESGKAEGEGDERITFPLSRIRTEKKKKNRATFSFKRQRPRKVWNPQSCREGGKGEIYRRVCALTWRVSVLAKRAKLGGSYKYRAPSSARDSQNVRRGKRTGRQRREKKSVRRYCGVLQGPTKINPPRVQPWSSRLTRNAMHTPEAGA